VNKYKQKVADLEHKISILETDLKEAKERIDELESAANASKTTSGKENQQVVEELVTVKMKLANTSSELEIERRKVTEAKSKLQAFSKQVKDLQGKLAQAEAKANEPRGMAAFFGGGGNSKR
jgi:predicted  nucleic acid-binding Zn-ribbon protein